MNAQTQPKNQRAHHLNYAPHIGLTSPEDVMFLEHAGRDPIEQIKFVAEQGFAGIEDNFLKLRPVDVQEKIGKELDRHSLQMGCFVNNLMLDSPTFVSDSSDAKETLLRQLQETIEVAKRVNGKYVTTLSGPTDPRLDRDFQTANMIENLKSCAELAEAAGIILGLEPLTGKWWHGTFMTTIPHAYLMVKAVSSPAVKLIFDTFHVQMEQGNIIETIDQVWDEIACFQIADVPGRNEPTTSAALENFLQGNWTTQKIVDAANQLAEEKRFFHWALEFPDVFEQGGFDCVLGNPPWERIKLQEKEFFASRSFEIANAANKSEREKLIKELPSKNPEVAKAFEAAKHDAEAQSKFIRESSRFPLTAVGDVNTYAVFAETARKIISPIGRAGIIVPTGIATDDTCKKFFGDISQKQNLAVLHDFENREAIFSAVHRSYKFSLLCISGRPIARAIGRIALPPITETNRCRTLRDSGWRL